MVATRVTRSESVRVISRDVIAVTGFRWGGSEAVRESRRLRTGVDVLRPERPGLAGRRTSLVYNFPTDQAATSTAGRRFSWGGRPTRPARSIRKSFLTGGN